MVLGQKLLEQREVDWTIPKEIDAPKEITNTPSTHTTTIVHLL